MIMLQPFSLGPLHLQMRISDIYCRIFKLCSNSQTSIIGLGKSRVWHFWGNSTALNNSETKGLQGAFMGHIFYQLSTGGCSASLLVGRGFFSTEPAWCVSPSSATTLTLNIPLRKTKQHRHMPLNKTGNDKKQTNTQLSSGPVARPFTGHQNEQRLWTLKLHSLPCCRPPYCYEWHISH